MKKIKLLMVDNYDSFTYNIVQYFGELGADIEVFRNDEIDLEGIAQRKPDRLVISPGPCSPAEAGISVAAIQHFAGKLPILGLCLGHLPHNVFIATLAMRQDAAQITLRTRGHEEGRFKAQHLGNFFLQLIHTGVIAIHIIAHQSLGHGFPHASGWPCDGVASKIDAG